MKLRPLTLEDEAEATAAHAELERENFEFLLGYESGMDWSDFPQQTEHLQRGIGVPAGRVPATFLVAEDEGRIIGRVSIRHRLNEYLLSVGGHIGYAVLPAFRRRGYASLILEAALVEAHGLGIESVLLTCDADNLASKATIERHGGIQEGAPDGGAKLRYWIGL
ncbi:GNAT family N-acetyltransferase [Arthrobacter tumbae]|uniref:GNAT family N-acetyltransferase n=1 Tax=Arthrobacter tumbae TaxID=163874 RepID=UPI00195C2724|nr:GNAT family N-acetyltransferase [Arthrobacter tumbae]MBM7781163.1 putative acetyltransferase [Arthrobacter tumbae]